MRISTCQVWLVSVVTPRHCFWYEPPIIFIYLLKATLFRNRRPQSFAGRLMILAQICLDRSVVTFEYRTWINEEVQNNMSMLTNGWIFGGHWWLPARGAPCTCPGIHLPGKTKCHLHSKCSPRIEMTGNERSLYPCLFRSRQACTCAVNKYK